MQISSLSLSIICWFRYSPDRISDEGCTQNVFVQNYYFNSSNMDLKTRQIPQSEWEKWKDTISKLTFDSRHTLQEVMDIMRVDHKFNARYL